VHEPASHDTPPVQVPPFWQVTLHVAPPHVTAPVVQEFDPTQSMLQLAALAQSTPFVQAPAPQVTAQGTPGGQRTSAFAQLFVPLQSRTQVPASQLPPASGHSCLQRAT
jgi:hypothetical protein